MDNSFQHLSEMILNLTAIEGRMSSQENDVTMEIEKMSIETPIELWISTSANGKVEIGSIPPLYHVETSFQPSFHSITIHTEKTER
ncbi:MAG: hypothetical protein EOO05_12345 [Chitinophagaceae bacterium]|nr:MAG: hypothetical protein EOO05_12345 [Chitinophagaceae bacterium]